MPTRYLTAAEMLSFFPGPQVAQALGATRNSDGTFTPDTAALEMFIGMAEDEADAYISTHYKLPLAETPPVLKQMVADLARYLIASVQKVEPHVQQRYDRAIAFFKQIASGKLLLGTPNQDTNVAHVNKLPTFEKRPSRFAQALAGDCDWYSDGPRGGRHGW